MGTPHPELLQRHPLTTRWNPQLDLFLEAPAVQETPPGLLAAAQWRRQELRLARGRKSAAWRRLARLADRARPAPDTLPRLDDYAWPWPDFTGLAMDPYFAHAPLSRFVLTALQGDEQLEALSELLREIGQHVAFALSRPCPVYETPQSVRVEFLGCLAFVTNRATRRLQLELRDARGDWQLSVQHFDLDHPLASAGWIEQALLPWLPVIERSFGAGAATAYEWLEDKLRRRYHQAEHLAATGRQIRHCLLTEPALARVLRRVLPHRPPREPQSLTYSRLWFRQTTWAELDRIAPGLVLFYYLALRQRRIRPGQQLGVLRDHCRACGLSPAGWRFLCRFGDWAYESLLLCGEPEDRPPAFEDLVAYIQWQAEAGLKQPLPFAWADLLVEAEAFHWQEGNYAAVVLDPRVARVAEAHTPGPQGGGREPIDLVDWHVVLEWLVWVQPELDANQWRAGWPAIRRAHAKWLSSQLEECWDSAVGPFTIDCWRVRPLTCGRELAEEGQRMRHCVGSYVRACREGRYRVFTVEHAETGAPVATIGLRLEGDEWQLNQVRGPANARAGEAMEEIGMLLLVKYWNDGVGPT